MRHVQKAFLWFFRVNWFIEISNKCIKRSETTLLYRFLDWSIAKITLSWFFIVACRTVAYKNVYVWTLTYQIYLFHHWCTRKCYSSNQVLSRLIKDCNVGTILATLCLLIARRHAMGVDVNLHFNINTVLKGKKKTLQMKMSKFVWDSFGECKKRTYFRTSCCLQYVSKSL